MKSKTTFAKRAFALLIAALMLVSILPAAVAAEEEASAYTAIEGIEWSKGYVSGSGSLTGGNSYSRSSVFVIEKAGTVVTFTDDGNFASSGAVVFSGWNLVDGEWVFDDTIVFNGANTACYTDANGLRTYFYMTTKDNQGLRISYRSEQTDSFIPEYATIYTVSYATWTKEHRYNAAPAELQNATFVPVTNFSDIGEGKTENADDDAKLERADNGAIKLTRNGGDWIQNVDWAFDEAQNWTGMTGILVKVDYTAANLNVGSNGAHGLNIGIHTATGSATAYNNSSAGGAVYLNATNDWAPMGPCSRAGESYMLVATPNTINKYAGYIFIPASAYTVEGLDNVTAISIQNGLCTSGTTVIEGIWLVKAADTAVSMEMEGYQDTTAQGGNTYDVRFLATINSLNVESYGFHVTASYYSNGEKNVKKTYEGLTTVYTGVLAAGEEQSAAAGEYFAPITIKGIPAGQAVYFTVTPYFVVNGTIVYGAPASYTVNAN